MNSNQQFTRLKRPVLIFSDLHWGQKPDLEKLALTKIKETIKEYNIATVLVAGDLLNIDLARHIQREDNTQMLVDELCLIKEWLGVDCLYLLNGNHDTAALYGPWKESLEERIGVKFLGDTYQDEQVRIEHGDAFWSEFFPPLHESLSAYRKSRGIDGYALVVGHRHAIFNRPNEKFFANGSTGKKFSVTVVREQTIVLIPLPVEFQIDITRLMKEYEGYTNAEELINQYVSKNVRKTSPLATLDQLTGKDLNEKTSWIVMDGKEIIGTIQHGTVMKLQAEVSPEISTTLQVAELASQASYTFQLGQKVKEAWAVFSATGETILPVIDGKGTIVGKISIFSVPKAEKEHEKTQEMVIDEKMKEVGSSLAEMLLKGRGTRDDGNDR